MPRILETRPRSVRRIIGILSVNLVLWIAATGCGRPDGRDDVIRTGSKTFTESVILEQIAAQLLRSSGEAVRTRPELGGTRVLWNALVRGDIDLYPEYTGTIQQELLAELDITDTEVLRAALNARGIRMSRPLGFNNTYAMGMRKDRAVALGIRRISDLANHPNLRFGFSNEFMDRADGWPSLRDVYGLPQRDVSGMIHDLAYRALEAGSIDVLDLYLTDAEIAYYDLAVLEDDRNHFPRYDAVLLYRSDLETQAPEAVRLIKMLEDAIPESLMVHMNARVKLDRDAESVVASDFLQERFQLETDRPTASAWRDFGRHTADHLYLVAVSMLAAILTSIPLGIWAARSRRVGQTILGVVGIIQTIPSLALLVFMIPLLGIGAAPAIMALFLYSLLPIVRNTYTALQDIPRPIRDSAEALGLPPAARLRIVELPMAASTILAGIKTSAVINVGTATLGALIGAGGYGQPILTGIRLDDIGLILQGAVPAAILALLVQGLFELLERGIVPRGLRV